MGCKKWFISIPHKPAVCDIVFVLLYVFCLSLHVKPFSAVDLITMFITRQPTQSGEFRESIYGSSGSPFRLIYQPCEPSEQGLVMWFRWVSHAGVSLPSPLSAPATVPHYTPCQRQPSARQRANEHDSFWQWDTQFALRQNDGKKWEEMWKEEVYRIRNVKIAIFLL